MMFDVLDVENIPVSNGVGNILCRRPEITMAASKPEVVITYERNEISAKFQRLPHIFGHVLLTETGLDTARRRATTALCVTKQYVQY